ncbi:MAG TPA: hypothetical protein VF342_06240 [Alphaproteobacteria bacterium]
MNTEPLPAARARFINGTVKQVFSKPRIKIVFKPSGETARLRYFPDQIGRELAALGTERIEVGCDGVDDADVLILTAHGSNLAGYAWNLRLKGFAGVMAGWFWNNHLAHAENLHTALAFDFVFASHNYARGVITNPVSILGGHVPACCAQWTTSELLDATTAAVSAERSDRLFCPYVAYGFSARTEFLRALEAAMLDAEVLLMPADDRQRYFGKSRAERLREWLGYKCSLVLPIDRDVSTRLFDALAAGQTVVVTQPIADLDAVIPPVVQQRLGIFQVPDRSVAAIQDAHRQALSHFDQRGADGIMERREYVMQNHMLRNRVQTMISRIEGFSRAGAKVEFTQEKGGSPGLILR